MTSPCQDGLVVSMSSCHAVGRGFVSQSGHTKDYHKMVQTASQLFGMQALGYEFDSAA